MDWLTFTVEMTKALAWPLSVVIVALAFRHQIRELLRKMRRGKVGFAEFEFEEKVKEIASSAAGQGAGALYFKAAEPRFTSEPRAVVLEEWLKVEDEIRLLARAAGIEASKDSPVLYLMSQLDKAGKVSPLTVALYRDMRHLRNQAAHSAVFEPEEGAVATYVSMAKTLRERLHRDRGPSNP